MWETLIKTLFAQFDIKPDEVITAKAYLVRNANMAERSMMLLERQTELLTEIRDCVRLDRINETYPDVLKGLGIEMMPPIKAEESEGDDNVGSQH